jgi:hypothetical protein
MVPLSMDSIIFKQENLVNNELYLILEGEIELLNNTSHPLIEAAA